MKDFFKEALTEPKEPKTEKPFNYFITGTRVYGPATIDSDLDIVMQSNESTLLFSFLSAQGITPYQTDIQKLEAYGGFYFELLGIKINIIEAGSVEEFESWKYATEKMRRIAPIADREKRCEIFQGFLAENIAKLEGE